VQDLWGLRNRRTTFGARSKALWRKEYGGLKVEQARRFKKLERENLRLRRAVADLTLDKLSMDLYGRVSLLRARRVARGATWTSFRSPTH
jgi:hypothetical protein